MPVFSLQLNRLIPEVVRCYRAETGDRPDLDEALARMSNMFLCAERTANRILGRINIAQTFLDEGDLIRLVTRARFFDQSVLGPANRKPIVTYVPTEVSMARAALEHFFPQNAPVRGN